MIVHLKKMSWKRPMQHVFYIHANLDDQVHGLSQIYDLGFRNPALFFVALHHPEAALSESVTFQQALQYRLNHDLSVLYLEAKHAYGQALDHDVLYEDIVALAKEMVLYWYLYADVMSYMAERSMSLPERQLWVPCELLDLIPIEHRVSTWIATKLTSHDVTLQPMLLFFLRQLENLVLPDKPFSVDEQSAARQLCHLKASTAAS
jgi:hypothetical protein